MNGSDIMENINNTPKIELEQIDELEMFNCQLMDLLFFVTLPSL